MIIVSILVLMLMITIHEFGHFAMAKLTHVPVYEFAVGMGPKIFSKKGKSETTYSLRCIPIGGFCSFDKGDATGIQDTELNKHPIWKRVVILLGGAGFNLISAFIVAVLICLFMGIPGTSTRIYEIADNRADSFLLPEDEIISVNGQKVNEDYSVIENAFEHSNGRANITVLRNGEEVSSEIQLFRIGEDWKMGVNMYPSIHKVAIKDVIPTSFMYCCRLGGSILESLKGLFLGKTEVKDMSGIVGIVTVMGDASKNDIRNLLSYFVMISINLGIVNMLPIPVLDGSKILFCLYEAVFKKKIPEKFESWLTVVFAFLLILLMIYVTVFDVFRIFVKK